MSYNILETHIEFKANKPVKITVLVEISQNDIRAIFATDNPKSVYLFIMPTDTLNDHLLQKIAARGCQVFVEKDVKKMFPNWKKYLKK